MQSDAQVKGLLAATTLPIRRYRWEISPGEAKPDVVEQIAADLNLPIVGQDRQPPVRSAGRFSHDKHLAHALRALGYGHMYFEQVGEIGDDGKWHLRKLATRPPRTISNFILDKTGGLEKIEQMVGIGQGHGLAGPLHGVEIPISRLVGYVWDSEDDADWVGRSILRACHPNWAIKSRLIRVDATKHERTGMGVVWYEVDPSASEQQIEELAAIAEAIRVGERGGGAGPGKLRIVGTEGSLPDTVASIRYHDEQMSKAFLLLFFDLGKSETGSRALGESFIDWYTETQAVIADWYRDITQAHVIEDAVGWNYGDDEPAPQLVYTRVERQELAAADLVKAVEAGLIAVDEETRAVLTQRWGLPPPKPGAAAPGAKQPRPESSTPPEPEADGQTSPEVPV